MEIDAKYKIWKACAQDEVRPILNTVHIEAANEQPAKGPRRGYAFAADGFEAVVVPVTLDAADVVPCNVNYRAFKMARRMTTKSYALVLRLQADGVKLKDGTLLPAAHYYNNVAPYPDIAALFNKFVTPDKPTVNPDTPRPITMHGDAIPFNPRLARKISKALGHDYLLFTQRYHNEPILVEAVGQAPFPASPSGIMMPVHAGDEREMGKRRDRWMGNSLPVFNPKPEPDAAPTVPSELTAADKEPTP